MRASRSLWRRRARFLGGLAAPVLLSLCPHASAQDAPPALPAQVVAPAAAPQVFDLSTARGMAVTHQPTVAAALASLSGAQLKAEAVDRIKLGALIARDVPVRKKQAALGVSIAQASVQTAECDARYAATFSYLAVLFAREQQKSVADSKVRLNDLKDLIKSAAEKGRRDVFKDEQLAQVDSFITLLEGRAEEAIAGEQRALAALREALGLGPDCPIEVVGDKLPDIQTKADRDVIVQLALSRRGEIIQVSSLERVFCLEVDAQGRILFSPARTFASGGDIHATPIGVGSFDPDYRPGPLAPEMSVTLTGSRHSRQEQAQAYHERSEAVAEKTRNLIGLEAADAYLRWKQFDEAAPKLEKAASGLEEYSNDLSKNKFNPDKIGYPSIEDLINTGLRTTLVRVDANLAKFRRLTALANLERVTAGGFDAGFDAAGPSVEQK
jgi:tetratricopeptide (TPR) repeat protein